MNLVDKIERKIVKIKFVCYILLYLNFYFCKNFCDAKSLSVPSKEVYMLRYSASEKNISIAFEIDFKNQTELLVRIRGNKRRDPVTFYDFLQRKVAYKDLNNKQCFVGDIGQETLEGDRRRLAQMKNGTVKGVYIPINLTIHREIKNQSEVQEQFGSSIQSFCNGSSVFDVTSDVKLSRKRRDTTRSSISDGNRHFTHHSYGISRRGAVDKDGIIRDGQRRQQQVRKAAFKSYASELNGSNNQDPPSNGPKRKRHILSTTIPLKKNLPRKNYGDTGSNQFSLHTAQDGYQMDYPFGGLPVGLPKPKLQGGIGLGKAPAATAQVGLPPIGIGGAASIPGGLPLGVPDTQLQAGIDLGKAPAATAQVGLPSIGIGGAASATGGLPLGLPDAQLQAGIDLGKAPAATAQVGLPPIGIGGAASVTGGLPLGLPDAQLQAGIDLGKVPAATAQVGLPLIGIGATASVPGGLPLGLPDAQLQAGIDLGKTPAATAQVGLPPIGISGTASFPGGIPLVLPDTQLHASIDLGKTPAATAQVGLPPLGIGAAASVPGGLPVGLPDAQLQAGIDLGETPAATAQVGLPPIGINGTASFPGGIPLVLPDTQLQAGIDLGKTTSVTTQGGLSTGKNRTQLTVPGGASSSYIPSRQQIPVLTPEIQSPQHISSNSIQPQSHVANQINLILQSNIPPNAQNIHLRPEVRQTGYHPSNTDTQSRVQIGYPSFVAEIPSMSSLRPEMQQPEHQQSHIPVPIPSQTPLSSTEQHTALEVPISTGFQPGHYDQSSTYISPPRPNSFQAVPRSPDLGFHPGYYQQPSSHISPPRPDQSPEVKKSPDVGNQPTGNYQRPSMQISPPKLSRPSISVFILPPGHQRSNINTQSRVSPPIPDRFQEVTNSPYYRFQPGHYQQSSTYVSPSRTDHSQEVAIPSDLRFPPGHYQQSSTYLSPSRTDHSQEVPKPSDLRFPPRHYQQISTHVFPSRSDHPQQIPNLPDLRYQPDHYQHRATQRPSTSVVSRTSKPGNSGQQRQGPREPDQGCCCNGRRKKKRRGGRRKQKAVLYALVPVGM